jgi:hypothetical protein
MSRYCCGNWWYTMDAVTGSAALFAGGWLVALVAAVPHRRYRLRKATARNRKRPPDAVPG